MSHFLETLHSGRVLLMDGAMGTELQRAGLPPDECGEAWNLSHPERVEAIHRSYVDAGAECLLTNTFQANPRSLTRSGLADDLAAVCEAALRVGRAAAGPARWVLGDVGPLQTSTSGESLRVATPLVRALRSADGLLVETASELADLAAILIRQKAEFTGERPPVLFSLTGVRTSSGDYETGAGTSLFEQARRAVRGYDIAALGVNCGRDLGMDDLVVICRQLKSLTDLPLFVRPNAGTPTRQGEHWVYPHSPAAMAAQLPDLLEAGVKMVGGCCGTTPEHIAAFRKVVEKWNQPST
jgi:5-methyltetrahydrofolate--homocysteine methyltransferase